MDVIYDLTLSVLRILGAYYFLCTGARIAAQLIKHSLWYPLLASFICLIPIFMLLTTMPSIEQHSPFLRTCYLWLLTAAGGIAVTGRVLAEQPRSAQK